MARFFVAALVCALTALDAFAFTQQQTFRAVTPEETAMKDVSFAPGAAAVILDWVEVDEDTNAVSAEYYRIKVLTEEGRKYADVEVPYLAGFPYWGSVTDISARTIQPDGRIVPFAGKVYDKVLMKGGGLRLRAKTFSLAEVQPGSILEYRFKRRWTDNLLTNTYWMIQREIPVLRAHMTLKPYNSHGEYLTYFTYYNLPEGKAPQQKGRDAYELEVTNVPPFQEERYAPPEGWLKMRVYFYYTSSKVEPEKFWNVQTTEWSKQIEGFIGKPGALAAEARKLAGKDAMETLQNVYAKAQTFRNLSYVEETNADTKKNAADVVAKAEGYRLEITRAFVALARAAGLDANVVRVAPRDRFIFSPNITDADQMDGEIAMAVVDGKTFYLDPGTPTAPFGIVSWEKSNVPGIKINKGALPVFNTVAEHEPEHAVTRRSADLRLNGDVLEGTISATFTGQEALARRLRTWGDDEATRTKDLEDEAKGWFPDGATVKLTSVTGATSHTEPLVVKYDVTLPGLVSEAGSRTVMPTSVFASTTANPFSSATRTHPIYFAYPNKVEDEVKVTLPETLSIAAVPAPAKVNGGALQYANEVKHEGKTLTSKRSMIVSAMLINKEYYTALRNFYSATITADQKPLVLVAK